MPFSALFGEIFGQTALSSLTFEREFFRCVLAKYLTSPAKSHREDARNGAYGLPFISGTIISDHLQMS